MKKIKLLLSLTLLIMLSIVACENDKNDDPEPEPKITTNDLKGDWGFVSVEYEGETYYKCDYNLAASNNDVTCDPFYLTLNLFDVTEDELRIYSGCEYIQNNNEPIDAKSEYTLEDNILKLRAGASEYEILNYDNFNGDILILKMIDKGGMDFTALLGAIYTLEKQ